MWADACRAMERAERLRRQFFHHGASRWEAPIDVFETDDALTILIALPGVELDNISVTLNAGTLTVTGERPLAPDTQELRMADAGGPSAAPTTAPSPADQIPAIPDDALILVTTRNLVLFP